MLKSCTRRIVITAHRSLPSHPHYRLISLSTKMSTPTSAPTSAPPAGEGGGAEPPSRSSLKKAEKEAALAAKKALKKASAPVSTAAKGEKKEKKEKVVAPVVEEPPFIEVPEGHKKDLTNPMASSYNPVDVEKSWYSWWRSSSYFIPSVPSLNPTEYSYYDPEPTTVPRGETDQKIWDRVDKDKVFVIPFPPPNVTGSLHIGHALAFGLQDSLIRWYRMRGYTTLFTPGFDHAGISTQSVVEKRLIKDEGLSRHDLGREKFLERCMEWKEDYQNRITNQLTRLGLSCDWGRVAFTMNEPLSEAVAETFIKLHEEGVIYRANRLVNWCVYMNTTLSNLEVDQKEVTKRTKMNVPGYPSNEYFEFGVITSFAYKIQGSETNEEIIVATTRPETMLGDTAIAVHPDDERYKHLHGKFVIHPFLPSRKIPIITDDIAVDVAFGTGAVKITPAHDPNDYETGLRHNLEFINILNDDGTFNANAGEEFKGMKRFHARVEVIKKLKERGEFKGDADNPMSIPVCSKSGDIIESIMKPQWWVKCKGMADAAVKATRSGELKIRPEQFEAEWYRWMENMTDWCISRQLWWGHRAPAYFVEIEGKETDRMSESHWVAGRTLEEATKKAELKFPGDKFTLSQDEDVFDTWFSSGLWPWSTMDWPDKTLDLEKFYPSSLLETGWDIIFFWVARMVMLGLHMTGKLPFSEVFCHALIRDAHGRKMSKSLGNVIDPIDVIEGCTLESLHGQLRAGNLPEAEIKKAEKGQKEDFPKGIPQCGTDALRFTLANYSAAGRDINLEILRVEGYRKFCNKLWNATRFAMNKLPDRTPIMGFDGNMKEVEIFKPLASQKPTGKESLVERWILYKLNQAAAGVNKGLADRMFMNATNDAYQFWLYEVCDVYIEAIKNVTDAEKASSPEAMRSAQNTLYTILDNGLRLLHPFMPFVTEELWQRLGRRPGDKTPSIMLAKFPEVESDREFEQAAKDFDLGFSGVKAIRSIAVGYGVSTNVQAFFQIRNNPTLAKTLREAIDSLAPLIKGCTSLQIVEDDKDIPAGCGSEMVTPELAVHLLLKGVIDADAEITKAEKKRAFAQAAAEKLKAGMEAPDYEKKKPEAVREKESAKLNDLGTEIDTLTASIAGLLKLKD